MMKNISKHNQKIISGNAYSQKISKTKILQKAVFFIIFLLTERILRDILMMVIYNIHKKVGNAHWKLLAYPSFSHI